MCIQHCECEQKIGALSFCPQSRGFGRYTLCFISSARLHSPYCAPSFRLSNIFPSLRGHI